MVMASASRVPAISSHIGGKILENKGGLGRASGSFHVNSGAVAGKVALIAGAASEIGRATATLLAEHGAMVWCSDRDADGAAATAGPIGGGLPISM